jgi:hypothetical protein
MNPKGFVKLTEERQIFLTKRFTMEELKKQLMGWLKNQSAGPKNWDLFKNDLFQMVEDLYENKLDVSTINYGEIMLLLKGKDAGRT